MLALWNQDHFDRKQSEDQSDFHWCDWGVFGMMRHCPSFQWLGDDCPSLVSGSCSIWGQGWQLSGWKLLMTCFTRGLSLFDNLWDRLWIWVECHQSRVVLDDVIRYIAVTMLKTLFTLSLERCQDIWKWAEWHEFKDWKSIASPMPIKWVYNCCLTCDWSRGWLENRVCCYCVQQVE